MPVQATSTPSYADLAPRPAATPSGQSVDKDAFLKLLVAQLKAQDPLSPMEGTQFVEQLATFSQVEQAISQTKQLEMVSLQLTGLASNEAIGLIGKQVTVRGQAIAFDGTNPTGFNASLAADTASTKVTIVDASGTPVRTLDVGPHAKGTVAVPWDGRNDAGGLVPPGNYTVQVEAVDAAGQPVAVTNEVSGTVVGVSFSKGYPEVELDSGARAPISDLVAVKGTGSAPGTGLPVGLYDGLASALKTLAAQSTNLKP